MQTERKNVIIKPVYCYIYCNFQQNIPLLCAVSDFVCGRPIAVNCWRMVIKKIVVFFRGGTLDVRWQSREFILSQARRLEGLGERPKLPPLGLGWSYSRKRFLDVLCDFTRVCTMQVSLTGPVWKAANLYSLQRQRVTQKQPMLVECWCWNNRNRTETGFQYVP